MQPITQEQAQAIIKQTLDQAMKTGIVQNMEAAAMIINAWNVITSKLKTPASNEPAK